MHELYTCALMPGLAHLYLGQEAVAVSVCEALLGAKTAAPSSLLLGGLGLVNLRAWLGVLLWARGEALYGAGCYPLDLGV